MTDLGSKNYACLHSKHPPAEEQRLGSTELKTPLTVPKMPSGDHLPNYGITAHPNWLEIKNPRMWTQNFEDEPKKFGGSEKFSGDAKKFPRNTKMFSGMI